MAEFDVIIIGAGPAGLAATVYALQSQLNVALVSPELGGKISYPFEVRGLPAVDTVWGAQLVLQFRAHVEAKLKAHFLQGVTQIMRRNGSGFQVTLADKTVLGARALILCTGAQPQKLYIPGEKEFWGKGVSFSATSHAQLFRGRSVAVIGGERGLTAVLKLATVASRVYYIVARDKEIVQSRFAEKALRSPNVFLFHEWEVQRVEGDQFVTGLSLVGVNGETRTLAVEGVFVEFGLIPNNELVRDLVALDEAGHVVVDQQCETSCPGLFAAGDVTNVYAEQVPVAIGEGIKAALSAWDYLANRR